MTSIDKIVLIGGSAGALPVLIQVCKYLPQNFLHPLVVVIHRQRNVNSELCSLLSSAETPGRRVVEPDDKEQLQPNHIYVVPQNYHLLFEDDGTISLDYSEAVKYSRPSIDVTFECAAAVFGPAVHAVLLSGANNDGTAGLQAVVRHGGHAIVQDPSSTEYSMMPKSAISVVDKVSVLKPEEIIEYLQKL